MAQKGTDEQRKYETIRTEWPVVYEIGSNTLTGSTVNVCNEGMMVESNLSLETAAQILKTLAKKRDHKLDVRFTYNKRAYRPQAEIRHFHLDFLGNGMCRSVAGFFMPAIR
ncbi:MAG: hypothetical protein GTO13_20610 [Proteobacteria bacterium]|nr:hypothetical protein [Pseudomonadota bacterium]